MIPIAQKFNRIMRPVSVPPRIDALPTNVVVIVKSALHLDDVGVV